MWRGWGKQGGQHAGCGQQREHQPQGPEGHLSNRADLGEMSAKYDINKLKDGFNDVDGERVFFVSNPALGLWAYRGRFD